MENMADWLVCLTQYRHIENKVWCSRAIMYKSSYHPLYSKHSEGTLWRWRWPFSLEAPGPVWVFVRGRQSRGQDDGSPLSPLEWHSTNTHLSPLIISYNLHRNSVPCCTYHVYTAPDFVRDTENWEPHSTLMTPRPVRESIWRQEII